MVRNQRKNSPFSLASWHLSNLHKDPWRKEVVEKMTTHIGIQSGQVVRVARKFGLSTHAGHVGCIMLEIIDSLGVRKRLSWVSALVWAKGETEEKSLVCRKNCAIKEKERGGSFFQSPT